MPVQKHQQADAELCKPLEAHEFCWSFLPGDWGKGSEERPGEPEKPQEKWTWSWLAEVSGLRQGQVKILGLHTVILGPWVSDLTAL